MFFGYVIVALIIYNFALFSKDTLSNDISWFISNLSHLENISLILYERFFLYYLCLGSYYLTAETIWRRIEFWGGEVRIIILIQQVRPVTSHLKICHKPFLIYFIKFILSPKDLISHRTGIGGSFPGLKQSESKTNHSSQSSAKVKNGGAIPPLPVSFHGVGHRDGFILFSSSKDHTIECHSWHICSMESYYSRSLGIIN
jgi:hypothetical protein